MCIRNEVVESMKAIRTAQQKTQSVEIWHQMYFELAIFAVAIIIIVNIHNPTFVPGWFFNPLNTKWKKLDK